MSLPAWLNRDLALLFVGRALRSLTQSCLTIVVPIYVAFLGFGALDLGYLFTAAALASAALAAAVGFLSDRFGRRNLLIAMSLLTTAAGVAFALAHSFALLMLAAAMGTVGRTGPAGAGASVGPYYPAEQALVAEHSSDRARTTAFGALAFVGVVAGAFGSLMAALPMLARVHFGASVLGGFRAVFWIVAVLGVVMAAVTMPVHEAARTQTLAVPPANTRNLSAATSDAPGSGRRLGLSRESWWLVLRFAAINGVNGLAVGMLGPFVVYWFYRRFAVNAAQLGQLFFVINLAAGVPNLLVGRISRLLGAVSTVVWARAISAAFLLATVLMPSFLGAACMYTLRAVSGALWIPVRQSYLMGLIEPRERATAAGLTNVPLQITSLVSPYFAGLMMATLWLASPIALAAILQGSTAAMYWGFFRAIPAPEERQAPAEARTPGRGEAGR
ncbi:MAG TPA: MFS transporter [Candidatus Binataceae bacterium]|nr:MFS transporter [Candidatus Binataceae bacterium]